MCIQISGDANTTAKNFGYPNNFKFQLILVTTKSWEQLISAFIEEEAEGGLSRKKESITHMNDIKQGWMCII